MEIPLKRSIVLVGMMGCGKTTVGSRLAQKIELPFIDLDKYIEDEENKSVSEIFEDEGEQYFRKLETKYSKEILNSKLCVLATGGGAFINQNTRDIIKKYGLSIYLKTDYKVLLERVSRKTTRPLLENGDKANILLELMKIRCPIYEEANIEIESSDKKHEVVVNKIIKGLRCKVKQY